MKLYIVLVGDDKLEYSYISDKIDVGEINRMLTTLEYPILGGSDSVLLRSGGGTVVCITQKSEFVYIIDIDYAWDASKTYDSYLSDKFESIRKSITRDIKLDKIWENSTKKA